MRQWNISLPCWLLLVLCWSLAGCRDGRVAKIEILGITPTGNIGEEGSTVQFSVQLDSSSPTALTYAWAFIGGIEPATSSDESPTVTLTLAGSYSGSLTIDDGGGGMATVGFSYEVAPGEIVIAGVTPTSPAGIPAGTVTFQALHTGTATEAEWTFEEGATPATSTELEPTVQLGEVGTYAGTVVLRNDSHTASAPFSFRVDPPVEPGWRVMALGPASLATNPLSAIQPWTCAFEWLGRPGVFFNRTDGLYLALASVADPANPADWVIGQVAEGHLINGTRIVAAMEASLHVLSFGPQEIPDPATGSGLFISSTTSSQPTDPADWSTSEIDSLAGWQWVALHGVEAEGLVVAYSSGDHPLSEFPPYSLVVSTTIGFNPSGRGSWTSYAPDVLDGSVVGISQLAATENRLYLLFDADTDSGPQRFIGLADVKFPVQSSDWVRFLELGLAAPSESEQVDSPGSIAVLGAKLVVAYSVASQNGEVDHLLVLSDSANPDLETPWSAGHMVGASRPESPFGYSFASASGRGVALVRDGAAGVPRLWRQLSADPGSAVAGSWMNISPHPSGGNRSSLAVLSSGKFLLAWINPASMQLEIAMSDGLF